MFLSQRKKTARYQHHYRMLYNCAALCLWGCNQDKKRGEIIDQGKNKPRPSFPPWGKFQTQDITCRGCYILGQIFLGESPVRGKFCPLTPGQTTRLLDYKVISWLRLIWFNPGHRYASLSYINLINTDHWLSTQSKGLLTCNH